MAYAIRGCSVCGGEGTVLVGAEYNQATGRLVQTWEGCPTCHGQGILPMFLYEPPRKRDVRAMDEDRLVWLAWSGSAREKHLAERELRRRSGR